MRCAIVCNTPLQVLGAMSILFNNIESCGKDADIFIIDEFIGAKDVACSIKKEKICRNAYLCNRPEAREGALQKIETLYRVCSTGHTLKCYGLENAEKFKNKYKSIFTGDGNFLGLSLKGINKAAEFIFYDDGIISYRSGNPLIDDQSRLYRFICKLLKKGIYEPEFDRMYLFAPSMSSSNISKNKCRLPVLSDNDNLLEAVKRIFHYEKNTRLESHKFILLGQMFEEIEGCNGNLYYRLVKDGYEDEFIVRKHPRQKEIERQNIQTDTLNNPWELDCIYSVNDNHVLVALCTSSQFTPRLVSNKEPYLIFTYKLLLDEKAERIKKIDGGYVEMLRRVYKNPDKIYEPDTFEEYDGILRSLAGRERK